MSILGLDVSNEFQVKCETAQISKLGVLDAEGLSGTYFTVLKNEGITVNEDANHDYLVVLSHRPPGLSRG